MCSYVSIISNIRPRSRETLLKVKVDRQTKSSQSNDPILDISQKTLKLKKPSCKTFYCSRLRHLGSPKYLHNSHSIIQIVSNTSNNFNLYSSLSVLLILASQRIEDIMGWDLPSDTTKRGSLPSLVEYFILAYVGGEKNNWNFAQYLYLT